MLFANIIRFIKIAKYNVQTEPIWTIKKAVSEFANCLFCGDPGEARTLDPLIKSQLLYQLSYGVFNYYYVLSDLALGSNAVQSYVFFLSLQIFRGVF